MQISVLPLLAALAVQTGSQTGDLPGPRIQPAPQRPCVLTVQRVAVRIVDGAATTEVEQTFSNPGGTPAEETFLFPIPPGTAVTDLALTVDGKPVRGEVLDKDRARQIYNEIVRSRRDPALLEYAGHGLIRASVFPVPPGGEAKVSMKYTTLLQPTGGLHDYTFPLRAAGLPSHGLRSLVLDLRIESARPILTIHSPSHKIDVVRDGDRRARVSLEGGAAEAQRDFRLVWGVSEAEFGVHALVYRRPSGEGTFLLFLAPRHEVPAGSIQPKDVVFVLDTSGSMAGEKIRQAKEALKYCLHRLRREDRFAVVRFSTESQRFREELAGASPEHVAAALSFVEGFEARGGTNIDEALASALSLRQEGGRLFLVVFLTDGLPTVGTTGVDAILANARARNPAGTRIFTFGVGHDVNTRLLDTLAEESRGSRTYVQPGEDIEVAVSNFYDQVSIPVLADPEVAVEGIEVFDAYPRRLPDLFKGSQVTLVGRFRGEGRVKVRLSGTVLGERREWVHEADFSAGDPRNDCLPALWATRKVAYLLDQMRLHGSNPELVQEVVRLGKEHGILTPYTSHLVVEEQARLARALLPPGGPVPDPQPPSVRAAAESAREAFDALTGGRAPQSGKRAVGLSADIYFLGRAPRTPAAPEGLFGILAPRHMAGKTFFRAGEFWLDASLQPADREKAVKVPFLGQDYFRLLEEEPELARFLSLGEKLLLRWKGKVYKIS